MIQKPKDKKKGSKSIKASKSIKTNKSIKANKSVKKIAPVIGKSKDEAYDQGFNDGYSKGLEDCGLDDQK